MSEGKRKIFTGLQKAKVSLEAVRGVKIINVVLKSTVYIRLRCVNGKVKTHSYSYIQ